MIDMQRVFLFAAVFVFALQGCALMQKRAVIESGKTSVAAPKDPGTPAKLEKKEVTTTVAMPAASSVVITKTAAQPATEKAPAIPEQTVTAFSFPEAAEIRQVAEAVEASTGTVDKSVALRRADNEARQPFLYASILAMVAAGIFVFVRFPTAATLSGAASVVFFIFYQVSGLPWWMWGLGVAALGIGAGIYYGYEKRDHERPT